MLTFITSTAIGALVWWITIESLHWSITTSSGKKPWIYTPYHCNLDQLLAANIHDSTL